MKDLLERLVRHIPAFLTTLLALIASPRRYALTRSSGTTADIEGALVFAILSAVLVFIMQVPLLSKETDVWTALASTLVVVLTSGLLSIAALRLAWFIVGGRAAWSQLIPLYAYHSGTVGMILLLPTLASLALFKLLAPTLLSLVTKGVDSRGRSVMTDPAAQREILDVLFQPGSLIAGIPINLGIVATAVFLVVGWRAYRDINDLPRWRSIVAWFIFVILKLPIFATLIVIDAAF